MANKRVIELTTLSESVQDGQYILVDSANATGKMDLKRILEESTLTDEIKTALLDCFAHVAWTDDQGQDYYDALSAALNPSEYPMITAVYSPGNFKPTNIDDIYAVVPYLTVNYYAAEGSTPVVIPSSSYTLSGSLSSSASTITVRYNGLSCMFNVAVSSGYASDGLIAFWDAINNTKTAGHSGSATAWTDIVNNYQLSRRETQNTTWTDDSAFFAGILADQGFMSSGRLWTPNSYTTIEVAMECSENAANQSVVAFDSSTDSTSQVQRNHKHICLYQDGTIGYQAIPSTCYTNPAGTFSSIKHIAITYSGYDATGVYINGISASVGSATHSYRLDTPNEYIGYGDTVSYPMALKGKIHAARVYNRVLSSSELASNLACDNERYSLGL